MSGKGSSVTNLALIVHVIAGTIALLAGIVAMASRKGERTHRASGTVFFVSMLVMAIFADYLAIAIPEQIPNLFIGTFTIYLVATAWLTVRRKERSVGAAEKIALALILCLCVPFVTLSFQLATGLKPAFKSAVPLEGPVRIAIYLFTIFVAMATIGDAKLIWAGGIAGARRIVRHLWRMCLGLTLAAGSAFTNGLPRLLPKTVHVPLILLFIPQLTSLALLVFWMIRVRFTGWYKDSAPN
ncbi:MAG TPA: DUF2306 domain-containing protein [Methylomirabilota bacterium]|nr:DUF2306 domain-containing protein [Methylomirabilota bacterium]